MTELSAFPNGSSDVLMMDELKPDSEVDAIPLPRVDAERGVFLTSDGNEVELSGKAVNKLLLERITNEGKPKIPMIEVLILGKHKQMQANPNDPGYLALLAEWDADRNIRIAQYLINVGVKTKPSQAFIDEQRQVVPNATDADMKYFYIGSLVPEGDFNALIDAIIGQTQTTAKGVESAANFSA